MKSWFTIILSSIIIVYLIVSVSESIWQIHQANQQLAAKQAQSKQLGLQRLELERQRDYMQTEAYIQQVARDELNLGRVGETVILLPDEIPIIVAYDPPQPPESAWWEQILMSF